MLTLLEYRRAEKSKISDHRAVCALFACKVLVVDGDRLAEVYKEITHNLGKKKEEHSLSMFWPSTQSEIHENLLRAQH